MKPSRFLTAFFAVLLLLSTLSVLADSTPEFLLSIETDASEYRVGDTVRVTCWLDRVDSRNRYLLYNFQEWIVFDSNALKLCSAAATSGFSVSGETAYDGRFHALPIRYQFQVPFGAPPLREASLPLAVFTFQVLQDVAPQFYYDSLQIWVDASGAERCLLLNGASGGAFPAYDAARRHTLRYSAESGGSVSALGMAYGVPVDSGDSLPQYTHVRLTATPDPYTKFDHWNDDVNDTQPVKELYVDSDMSLTAHFVRTHSRVSFGTERGGGVAGTVTPTGGSPATIRSGDYQPVGSVITLTATPKIGYSFSRWKDDPTAPAVRTLTLTDDLDVTAIFTPDAAPYTPPSYTPAISVPDAVPLIGNSGASAVTAELRGTNVQINGITSDNTREAGIGDSFSLDVAYLAPDAESVTVPAAAIDTLKAASAIDLKLTFPEGTVSLDNQALCALSERLNGKSVTCSLQELPAEEAQITANHGNDALFHNPNVYHICFDCGGETINDPGNGEITVAVPYESDADIRVFAVDGNGDIRLIPDSQEGGHTYFPLQPENRYLIADLATAQARCTRDKACISAHFPDVDPQEWYHSGIHYCVDNGLMVGYDDGKFYPNSSLTRAQLVTVLWRMEGEPIENAAPSFSDVSENDWFYAAVSWAGRQGIVNGYGNGKFGPNDFITREQLAAVFFRYANANGYSTVGRADLRDYHDYALIQPYAVEPLRWASFTQMLRQRGFGFIAPNENALRCEIALMIQQYRESVCVSVS